MNALNAQTEKIRSLLKDFPTAMLITHGNRGRLHARPMAVAEVRDDCALWFITGENTSIAWEVSSRKQAHVVFQNDQGAYLSISGTATLVHDRDRVKELWKEPLRVWFPGGIDDPSLVLVLFHPERAEYWDHSGLNKISYLWEAARACVSGKAPPPEKAVEHGVVSLR